LLRNEGMLLKTAAQKRLSPSNLMFAQRGMGEDMQSHSRLGVIAILDECKGVA
jgi:hypothetical protein